MVGVVVVVVMAGNVEVVFVQHGYWVIVCPARARARARARRQRPGSTVARGSVTCATGPRQSSSSHELQECYAVHAGLLCAVAVSRISRVARVAVRARSPS